MNLASDKDLKNKIEQSQKPKQYTIKSLLQWT
jgi:hypothetical protein